VPWSEVSLSKTFEGDQDEVDYSDSDGKREKFVKLFDLDVVDGPAPRDQYEQKRQKHLSKHWKRLSQKSKEHTALTVVRVSPLMDQVAANWAKLKSQSTKDEKQSPVELTVVLLLVLSKFWDVLNEKDEDYTQK